MTEIIDFLLTRSSVKARKLIEPGPSAAQLDMILRASARVPDHGKLNPWRFIVIQGDARAEFGEVLAAAYRKRRPDASDDRIEIEKRRFQRAPLIIAVSSHITRKHKVPKWEQTLSGGAACMNMLHAAHALGFAAQWLTECSTYDADVAKALGVGRRNRIAGFIYIGTATQLPKDRRRPELGDIVTEWRPPPELRPGRARPRPGRLQQDRSGLLVVFGSRRQRSHSRQRSNQGHPHHAAFRRLPGRRFLRAVLEAPGEDTFDAATLSYVRELDRGVKWSVNLLWADHDGEAAADTDGTALSTAIRLSF